MRTCIWRFLFFACAYSQAVLAQGLLNPSFETGSLDPWQVNLYGGTGTVAVVANFGHGGYYGLVEGPTSSTQEVAYQDVYGLTPGQTYVVSVWVASSQSNTGTVSLAIHDVLGNGWIAKDTFPGTSWQKISQAYTVDGTGAMRVHLYQNPGPETTYWDDVTIEPVLPLNSGFETGSLSSWQTYIPGPAGNLTVVSSPAYSGSYSLAEGPNSSLECAYQDIVGLTPGQTYIVSAWVLSSVSSNIGTVRLAIHDTLGTNLQAMDMTPAPQWQHISQSYTVNDTGAMRVHLYQNGGSETTYWDDVSVIPLPPVNAGFESGSLGAWQGWGIAIGTTAHSGNHGLTESPTASRDVVYQDIYGLTAGQTYLVSAWVKSSSSTTGTVSLEVHDTQGSGWVGNTTTPGTSWQQVSQAYTATWNGAMRIHFYQNAGSETTYWDDVTVVPVPPVNAGFETGSLGPWQGWGIGIGTTWRSGNYGLTESPTDSRDVAFQDVYGLTPGQTYTVSAWVKSSASTTGTVSLEIHDTLGNAWVGNTMTPTTNWQQISQSYTVSANGAMRIHLYQNGGAETTYWDDVTVSGPSFGIQSWSNLALGLTGITEGISSSTVWSNLGFSAVSAAEPAKEYIRMSGQVIAIENGIR